MEQELNKVNQEIQKTITSLQQAVKAKNFNLISSYVHSLNQLILSYLLALDYDIKNLNIDNPKFNEYKLQVNAILLKLKEFINTKDENLLNEIDNYLIKLSNINLELSLSKESFKRVWDDNEEQLFLSTLNFISELSNKVYQYYKLKGVMKQELIEMAKKLENLIQNLPDLK
ncbi:MAG: hypothetical protein N2485_03225 [bacterium]|nr:hypothetical protein [bacterium]